MSRMSKSPGFESFSLPLYIEREYTALNRHLCDSVSLARQLKSIIATLTLIMVPSGYVVEIENPTSKSRKMKGFGPN